jgi:hypothetical protein
MILEVAGLEEKLHTHCVGHARGRFVVVQMPFPVEAGRDALYQLLYPDAGVIARYLYEGTVVGFSARVVKWIQVPFPLLFLSYPAKLESYDLRRHRRVACCIPGMARIGATELPGMLLDLSQSGCQFSAALVEAPPALRVDDVVELFCPLFDHNQKHGVSSLVMRVEVSSRRLETGLRFCSLPEGPREALSHYLEAALTVLE